MLSDNRRIEIYRTAINRKAPNAHSVLEIGCGPVCLLAINAARAGTEYILSTYIYLSSLCLFVSPSLSVSLSLSLSLPLSLSAPLSVSLFLPPSLSAPLSLSVSLSLPLSLSTSVPGVYGDRLLE